MPPLPFRQRLRTDLLCLIAGLVFFGVALLFIGEVSRLGRPGAPVLIFIALMAGATGAGAIGLFRSSGHHPEVSGYHAARLGARAGILSALLAAGMIVLAARLSDSRALFTIWLSAPLCILPGALAGMGGASAAIRLSPVTDGPADKTTAPVEEPGGISWLAFAITGLAIGGLLSPFYIHSWRSYFPPPPVEIVKEPVPEILPKPVEPATPYIAPPPPRPSFRFDPSPALAATGALRWNLTASRPLPDMAGDGPMSLSNDGRWLACVAGDGSVVVTDLHTAETTSRWQIAGKAQAFAFSPDNLEMIYVTADTPAHVGVLRVSGSRVIPLPQPKKRLVPATPPVWHKAKEVFFLSTGEPPLALNLDTLEIDPAVSPDEWKAMSADQRKPWTAQRQQVWPESDSWKLSPLTYTTATELPEVEGVSSGWPERHALSLGVSDKNGAGSLVFPAIDLQKSDRFLAAKDGSKFIRCRGDKVEIFYFSPSAKSPEAGWKVKMPHAPDFLEDLLVQRAVEEKTLCAFVYRPLINPLNQQVIGPDRSRVFSLARLEKWEGEEAVFRNAQQSAEALGSLIIADPHRWNGGQPLLVSFTSPHRWWAEAEPAELSAPASTIASLNNQPELDARFDAGALRIENFRDPKSLSTRPEETSPSEVSPTTNLIGDFIIQHHRNAQNGDVTAFVAGYADRVDHFSNGIVDRAFIEKDERKYHAEHTDIKESVLGNIRIRAAGPNRFEARYTLRSTTVLKKDNSLSDNVMSELLVIELQNGQPRIVKHHATKTSE